MAENGEIAQAFAPQHRKLQAFMVTFSQHFRVLLEIILAPAPSSGIPLHIKSLFSFLGLCLPIAPEKSIFWFFFSIFTSSWAVTKLCLS